MEIDLRAAGQRIKQIRLQHHYTMLQFAKMLGFASPSTVNNWEKGNNLPIDTRLTKIAILGNTSVNWIKYGDFQSYVQKLLEETYNESRKTPYNDSFLRQLLEALQEKQLSYNDDLQILIVAKKIYPEFFDSKERLNEYMVGETYTNYSIETDKFYRGKVLPKIEHLFSTSKTQSLSFTTLLSFLDLLDSATEEDPDYLKLLYELIQCFLVLLTLEKHESELDSEKLAIKDSDTSDKPKAKLDYLKSKNQLISLLDTFHIRYHFK